MHVLIRSRIDEICLIKYGKQFLDKQNYFKIIKIINK